jgi:hypothetical protein
MQKETLHLDPDNRKFKAQLSAVEFKEDHSFILYLPSLNISAYGDTPEEAHELLRASLAVFSEDLFQMEEKQREEFLADLGWKNKLFFKRKLEKLSTTTFEDIVKQFDLPVNTQVQQVPIAV